MVKAHPPGCWLLIHQAAGCVTDLNSSNVWRKKQLPAGMLCQQLMVAIHYHSNKIHYHSNEAVLLSCYLHVQVFDAT